ncbi:MAG: AmmeMemoRadiSam system protein B, partial [Treponema sp.]|nr:AmmeMemoRadiSam system protein B [Treponema sp.]
MEDRINIRERIRSPIVGGLFYPEAREEAEDQLSGYLREWEEGRAKAIIAPHGAWDISGRIAGAAFAAAAGIAYSGQVSRVVIL